ncbi:MAG: hypothetical protein K0R18_229 [Bacillales bacterium]|jgi:hypothetical protein|nr:hypothetical protein [Bacillales bacterium]
MKNKVHWCMQKKMWTSHVYNACAKAKVILIDGYWSVETKPNNRANPKGWVFTDHTNVIINPSDEILMNIQPIERLLYDKRNVKFNIKAGNMLLFNEHGCFIVEKIS